MNPPNRSDGCAIKFCPTLLPVKSVLTAAWRRQKRNRRGKLPECKSPNSMRVGQTAQNWNGATVTDILPSDDCWTVKLTSFEAFVSPTVTDMEPLHSGFAYPHSLTL